MQSASYPNYNRYADALAQKRKRQIIKKIIISVTTGVILAGIVGYVFFFTPYFQIESFSFYGLKTVDQREVEPVLDSVIKNNVFHVFKSLQIQQQKNILFFNSNAVKESLLAQFPVIKSLEIKKSYFHKIIINFSERNPVGVWCFDQICRYFDNEGFLWGQAIKSSGALLINVSDLRPGMDQAPKLESEFLIAILKTIKNLEGLKMRILKVEIPADSVRDFKVYNSEEYFILMNTDTDIDGQINILRIFLEEKGDNFKPAYLDLRIAGRVYYK